MDHSPTLLGYERECQEYVADYARFFGWAWSEFLRTACGEDVYMAIGERLWDWKPVGKAN